MCPVCRQTSELASDFYLDILQRKRWGRWLLWWRNKWNLAVLELVSILRVCWGISTSCRQETEKVRDCRKREEEPGIVWRKGPKEEPSNQWKQRCICQSLENFSWVISAMERVSEESIKKHPSGGKVSFHPWPGLENTGAWSQRYQKFHALFLSSLHFSDLWEVETSQEKGEKLHYRKK